MQDIRMYLGPM